MTSATQAATQVPLPALGEHVTEATVTQWLKQSGDHVAAGEPLLEVATDKVDTEIASPAGGIVADILVPEGHTAEVGAVMATLVTAIPPEPEIPAVSAPVSAAPAPRPVPEIAEVSGDRVEKLPRIRQTIARRMLESLQTSAQLTTVVEVDVTAIASLRAQHKDAFHRRVGAKLSFLPFVAAAAVEALREHQVVNASLNSECTQVTYHGSVHLGMAVDSAKGLMVPVIRDAEQMSIADLARSIARLADDVRNQTIRPDDLQGGTFTITNTGSRGALFDTPIINQPQSAILGVGAVVERVVPRRDVDGNLTIDARSMMYLSLSYDHRIVDGADAARYLTAIRSRLESGYTAQDLNT